MRSSAIDFLSRIPRSLFSWFATSILFFNISGIFFHVHDINLYPQLFCEHLSFEQYTSFNNKGFRNDVWKKKITRSAKKWVSVALSYVRLNGEFSWIDLRKIRWWNVGTSGGYTKKLNLIQLFLKTKFGHTLFLLYLTEVNERKIAKQSRSCWNESSRAFNWTKIERKDVLADLHKSVQRVSEIRKYGNKVANDIAHVARQLVRDDRLRS